MSAQEFDSTCTNNGCKQKYKTQDNHPTLCVFHPGKPIFHDLKKGWACCNVIVYDWDEFQKIKGCQTGPHIPKTTQTTSNNNQSDFEKSTTVARAENAIANFTEEVAPVKVKQIDDFNKEQKELEAKKKTEEVPKKLFLLPNGNLRCTNKGCNKEFKENDNQDTSCKFHVGAPVFHDIKKYWTCCKKETWDWDEFMKIPTCAVGFHTPKMV